MVSATPSPLASSVETTIWTMLSRLVIDGGTAALRKVFDRFHPPANLEVDLSASHDILKSLFRRRILNSYQWERLFPPDQAAPDSSTFDITLLYLLLTNICGLSPPPIGWHSKPPASDSTLEANIARIKFFRNQWSHLPTTSIDTEAFTSLRQEINDVLLALELAPDEVHRLNAEPYGEERSLNVLHGWENRDHKIKTQLEHFHQIQKDTCQALGAFMDSIQELNIPQDDSHLTATGSFSQVHSAQFELLRYHSFKI